MPKDEPPSEVPVRQRMPDTRPGITRNFRIPYTRTDNTIGILKLYVTANCYSDGKLGEVFIKCDKKGGLTSGALDAIATLMSIALQHGVPLEAMTSKLRNNRFGPSGFTGDKEFPTCSSPFDLIAQFLDARFPAKEVQVKTG